VFRGECMIWGKTGFAEQGLFDTHPNFDSQGIFWTFDPPLVLNFNPPGRCVSAV